MAGRTRSEQPAGNQPSRKLDIQLDTALAQTFPASDPFEVGRFTSTEPPARPVDREAPRPEIPQPSRQPPRRRAQAGKAG